MGFRITRGWASLLLVIGALVATAFWIGPLRPQPPDLRLVALSGDGSFREVVGIPFEWVDTTAPSGNAARVPLVLAVYNAGARPAEPRSLALSMPTSFHLATREGQFYSPRTVPGNPLRRYSFNFDLGRVEPGQLPRVIPRLDTLWLVPALPSYYCTALADSIPDFVPAPVHDPQTLSRLKVFYSLGTRRQRQTGTLDVQLDPALLQRTAAPMPPVFRTTMHEPAAPRPDMGALAQVGAVSVDCGDPGEPMQLYSVLWETAAGGRFFVLHYGGAPRKYLFDLDRDSTIELEMWDPDHDGQFEATRTARMPIPEFLIPRRPPPPPIDTTRADSLAVDSLRPDSLRPDSLRRDSTAVRIDSAGRPAVDTTIAPPVDTALARRAFTRPLFDNTDAGPFRFWNALERAKNPPPVTPQPQRQRGPRLLGVPVDSIRRDTTRR